MGALQLQNCVCIGAAEAAMGGVQGVACYLTEEAAEQTMTWLQLAFKGETKSQRTREGGAA